MKNRKRFTALTVAALLALSTVSGTGSMVLAEEDTTMETQGGEIPLQKSQFQRLRYL